MTVREHVGLLITPQAIEAAHCVLGDDGQIRFDFHHHLTLETSLVDEEGEVADSQALGEALATFWAANDIRCRHVVVGLYGRGAIARLVSLPRIPANQLQQVVLSEAEQYSVFREEEPLVDYFTVDTDTDTSTVFYAATSKRLLDAYAKALKVAKLSPLGFDLVHFAGLRQLVNARTTTTEHWDGVAVMALRLVITSWQGKNLQNWREVALQRHEAQTDEQGYQQIETEVTRTLLEEAGTERELLVAGASLAESARLSDYFRSHTDTPLAAVGLEHWAKRVPPSALEHISPACLGLALWGYETAIPSLDLSRSERFGGALGERLSVWWAGLNVDRSVGVAALLATLGLLTGAGGVAYMAYGVVGAENQRLEAEITGLTADTTVLNARLTALKLETDTNKAILDLIGEQAAPNLAVNLLAETSDIVPADAYLSRLSADTPTTVLLEGAATSQGSGLLLAHKLAELREVSRVSLLEVLRSEAGLFSFRIKAEIQPGSLLPTPSQAGTVGTTSGAASPQGAS
ncbi:MAG: pilus assembly protein PilM [Candidatus Sericytochromatia bacterium]|nr:pilus assembly protein PilM [Candidatus Sericytochromatia bacterium]